MASLHQISSRSTNLKYPSQNPPFSNTTSLDISHSNNVILYKRSILLTLKILIFLLLVLFTLYRLGYIRFY